MESKDKGTPTSQNITQNFPQPIKKKKIGDLLVESGLINKHQLEEALRRQEELKSQGKSVVLGQIIVDLHFMSSKQILAFIKKHKIKIPFGELLLLNKKITKDDLAKALEIKDRYPGKPLGTIFVNILKVISDDTLMDMIAAQHEIHRVKPDALDFNATLFFAFKEEFLKTFLFVPYRLMEGENSEVVCQVLISNPARTDLKRIESLIVKTIVQENKIIAFDSANTQNIKSVKIEFEYSLSKESEILEFLSYVKDNRETIDYSHKIQVDVNDQNAVVYVGREYYSSNVNLNIFIRIITSALEKEASDIHIEPMKDRMRVRLRIDGILMKETDLPKSLNRVFVRGLKNYFRFKDSHLQSVIVDGRKSVSYPEKGIEADLRISILPSLYGDAMVIRILVQNKIVPTFEMLGMSRNILLKYQMVIASSSGIVIVTGPTGSGKTTTLFSTIESLNEDHVSILTLEDPPEYHIPGVIQANVSAEGKRDVSYLNALKSALRQDPDIIMFGEMRDAESASVALSAGLTGHLLFTTLHTNDAPSAITRLADMGIKPFLLSSTLVSILAQRLVRKVCPYCREEYVPDISVLNFFAIHIRNLLQDYEDKKFRFYRGKGCKYCNPSGFKGRQAIYELLCVNDIIRRIVLNGGTAKDVLNTAREFGMTSMIEDGFVKATNGVTTIEEISRVAKSLENNPLLRNYEEIHYLVEGELTNDELMAAVYSSVNA